jgi:hypothetical protein
MISSWSLALVDRGIPVGAEEDAGSSIYLTIWYSLCLNLCCQYRSFPSLISAIIDIPAFLVERYRSLAHRPEYGSGTSRLTDIILAAIQDDLVASLPTPYSL